jgi:hypothetical protein
VRRRLAHANKTKKGVNCGASRNNPPTGATKGVAKRSLYTLCSMFLFAGRLGKTNTAFPIRLHSEGRDNDEGVRALMLWRRTNREAGWVLQIPRSGLGAANTAKRARCCKYREAGWALQIPRSGLGAANTAKRAGCGCLFSVFYNFVP